jgi:hypothetical protein
MTNDACLKQNNSFFLYIFCGVRVSQSLVFCVVLCGSLFVLLFFLFWWPLCCLSFFYLPLLITLLVSSDYPFGIFWLPFWYLLITLLVSSDYPFGIFWLPFWYLQTCLVYIIDNWFSTFFCLSNFFNWIFEIILICNCCNWRYIEYENQTKHSHYYLHISVLDVWSRHWLGATSSSILMGSKEQW